MSEYKQSKQHYLNYCRHFPEGGILNDRCLAGVSLRVIRSDGHLPCIVSNGICDTCPKFERRSEEEAHQYAMQSSESLIRWMSRLEANQCPHCGKGIDKRVTVRHSIYLEPCGHRIGST